MISSMRQMLAHGAPAAFKRLSHALASSLASASSILLRSAASFCLHELPPPSRYAALATVSSPFRTARRSAARIRWPMFHNTQADA